jgi:hypothetical protein
MCGKGRKRKLRNNLCGGASKESKHGFRSGYYRYSNFFLLYPVLDGPLGGTKGCTVQALVEADADLKASRLALSELEQERKTVFITWNGQLWKDIYYMEHTNWSGMRSPCSLGNVKIL